MIMIEFEKDKEILTLRNKFLDVVNRPYSDSEYIRKQNASDFEESIIRLINMIGKRINIDVEQLDIKNKVYWPCAFDNTSNQQKKLLELLILNQEQISTMIDKINKKQFSIGVFQDIESNVNKS